VDIQNKVIQAGPIDRQFDLFVRLPIEADFNADQVYVDAGEAGRRMLFHLSFIYDWGRVHNETGDPIPFSREQIIGAMIDDSTFAGNVHAAMCELFKRGA